MPANIIKYSAALKVLVSVKGHPFERDPFGDIFESYDDIAATFVDQPASSLLMNVEGMKSFDVLCLYDMPGIDFMHPDSPGFVEPSEELKNGFEGLLKTGKGILALHHSIAGWPAWPDYAEYLGGRFLYKSDDLRGERLPDSGYRHEVTYNVSKAKGLDPLFAPLFDGIKFPFEITDELYLSQVFEEDVIPLFYSDYDFRSKNFFSAQNAVKGDMNSREGWSHAQGSNLVGWVKKVGKNPLIYLQFGDDKGTYENPNFRKLIENALCWLGSNAALDWAKN